MIPKNAIKKVKNDIHLEIAAGSLLAYGVFPQTAEGIQRAKETAASKDTWLAPSDLPEYYANIDDDLLKGRENDAIRAIRKTLKEFYGISSAGTEDYVDTRSSRPATPAGIEITWFSFNQVGPSVWETLKAQLTGKGYFSEVDLSEKDADKLIANIKKSGEFPSLEDQSGIQNEVYQNWLVDTYLPEYRTKKIYEQPEEIVVNDKPKEEKEVVVTKNVNHPKLPLHLQKVHTHYLWGNRGKYSVYFESDIDKAIYHSIVKSTDKEGYYSKTTQQKTIDFRTWLFEATGLSVHDMKDYDKIKSYKKKILETIREILNNDDVGEIEVPPVYDGFYQDPEEYEEEEEDEEDYEEMDEEEEDEEEEEDDDLYGNSLDDLLGNVRDEEAEDPEDPEELKDQIEEKKKELEDAVEQEQNTTGRKTLAERMQEAFEDKFGEDFEEDEDDDDFEEIDYEEDDGMGSEETIPDEVLDDSIDPTTLEEVLNKKRKKTGTKERKSYYVSNTKLLQGITKSLAAVTGQLEQVNQSLLEQNQLIQTNIDVNLASLEALRAQDDILTIKFDAILNAFQQQYEASKKAEEDAKRLKAEQKLEGQVSTSGTEDPEDLTKGGKGGGRINRINQYYRTKLVRQLYRRLPRQLRSLRTRGRKLQKMPGKAAGRIKNSAASKISRMLPSKVSNFGKNISTARSTANSMGGLSKIKGVSKNIPGIKQALAVWEYGDRKSAGQSDMQAAVGVGGGLAGAAAGAAIGTMLFPGVGTVAGLLIGAAFSAAGGYAGSKIADTITGVEDKQYEQGTNAAKPGTAMLHGTELLIDKDKEGNLYGINTIGATLIAATSKFINSLGPAGSAVAPLFEQKAAPLIQLFGAPATTAQTNVGGGFPSIGSIFKKAEKKKESFPDEYEGMSREEIEMLQGDTDSFAEKLLKMIDPEDKFKNFLDGLAAKIRNPFTPLEDYDGTGIEGDLKGNIVNPMEQGELQDYPGAKFGAPRSHGTHKGRDIIGPKGMKFVAAMPGKVTQIINVGKLPNGGWSKGIYVKHDNGMETRYLHVTPSVKVGDAVKAGQKLGVLTEKDDISSVAHLHFELLVNGRHVDPDKAGNSILKKAYKLADIQAGKVPGLNLDPSGKTPLETYNGTPTSGQEITQNFGMQTGQEKMFTSGGKQYKAHKTEKGFEFFDGMMPIQTRGGENNQLVRDFMQSQGVQFNRPDNDNPADDFMRKNGITPAAQKPFEFINQKNTDTSAVYMVLNQQQAPEKAADLGVRFIESGTGKWVTDKEYDVKTLEKLRLSL
jgi:murein DD-endopeptidase MepM/ murein hydrolase activator NlpD